MLVKIRTFRYVLIRGGNISLTLEPFFAGKAGVRKFSRMKEPDYNKHNGLRVVRRLRDYREVL